MNTDLRWTSADLESLPYREGWRYEIIDGELFTSDPTHFFHQSVCANVACLLGNWGRETGLGLPVLAPGVIFAEDEDVAPDVVWCSHERLALILEEDGYLHAAPELIAEVLSPDGDDERRDREVKLNLYSRRGVEEYWILDWMIGRVEVYRRKRNALHLAETLGKKEILTSPLLPGFSCRVAELFDETLNTRKKK